MNLSSPMLRALRVTLRPADSQSPQRLSHLRAALQWIEAAHTAAGDGGISKGYDLLRSTWAPSYPETTGYTIPTLLNTAAYLGYPHLRYMALSLADYLLGQATPEGGITHWERRGDPPVVFDTGQALFGWVAAYRAAGALRYLEAARRAAAFLVQRQDAGGAWLSNQHLGVAKTIDTRVAWALLELHALAPAPEYAAAARRNLAWALRQQEDDGWFRRCAFREHEAPFTHTLAYTAEGLLACGIRLGEGRYIEAARRTAQALRERLRPDGALTGAWKSGWQPLGCSTCLTGNCQMSILWMWLYRLDGEAAWLDAARRALTFAAGTQILEDAPAPLYGGIAGSAPLWGRYERMKYPNWAAKFFIDALLWMENLEQGEPLVAYAG